MVGHRAAKSRWRRIALYSTPFIALSLLLVGYYVVNIPPAAAEDYTLNISIQISALSPDGTTAYLYTVYPTGVGVSGGTWVSHQFDSYGLNGHYPLYAEAPPGWNNSFQFYTIHVKSRVVVDYTLIDFFNVWGEPLGQNNTLHYTVPSSSPNYGNDWYWDMCVRPPGGAVNSAVRVPFGGWANQPLDPGILIILIYSNHGCA